MSADLSDVKLRFADDAEGAGGGATGHDSTDSEHDTEVRAPTRAGQKQHQQSSSSSKSKPTGSNSKSQTNTQSQKAEKQVKIRVSMTDLEKLKKAMKDAGLDDTVWLEEESEEVDWESGRDGEEDSWNMDDDDKQGGKSRSPSEE